MGLDEELNIKFERLNEYDLNAIPNKIEVTEPNVLNLLSQVFTGSVIVGSSTGMYKASLPRGEELAKVKGKSNTFRGYYHGEKGTKGHAEFSKGLNPAGVMYLASFAVGQYYMNDISTSLNEMNDNLEHIQEFQKEELKAKVKAGIISIQKKTHFIKEILDSDEIRVQNYDALLRNEDEISQIISQVNGMILNLTKKNNEKLKSFQQAVIELSNLQKYQGILLTLLNQIGQLAIYLSQNNVSIQQAYYAYTLYYDESEKVDLLSKEWLLRHEEYFQFDDENRRVVNHNMISRLSNTLSDNFIKMNKLKNNKLNNFIENTADRINYKTIDDEVAYLIDNIANIDEGSTKLALENPYEKEVQYIKDGDKVFYIVA